MRPTWSKPRVMLATVKTASRRLRRWPAASPDRRCACRTITSQAGAEKRHLAEPRNRCEHMISKSVRLLRGDRKLTEVRIERSVSL